jgi:hypothetical protein
MSETRDVGMRRRIPRRDSLNGVALAIGAFGALGARAEAHRAVEELFVAEGLA